MTHVYVIVEDYGQYDGLAKPEMISESLEEAYQLVSTIIKNDKYIDGLLILEYSLGVSTKEPREVFEWYKNNEEETKYKSKHPTWNKVKGPYNWGTTGMSIICTVAPVAIPPKGPVKVESIEEQE